MTACHKSAYNNGTYILSNEELLHRSTMEVITLVNHKGHRQPS